MKSDTIRIGIQGGPGSFNQSALELYLSDKEDLDVEVSYLNTTPNVLEALTKNEIDWGQFALCNSLGGFYDESLGAIGKYLFNVIDTYPLKVSHSLMISKYVELPEISKLILHQQVLKQCERNLRERFSHLEWEMGDGELTDPANVAKHLANGMLPTSVAVVSNPLLAEIYDLKIVERDLQDSDENRSFFLLVSDSQSV